MEQPQTWRAALKKLAEHIFLHYGAGQRIFGPLKRVPHLNTVMWMIIIAGIVGWLLLFLWLGAFDDYRDAGSELLLRTVQVSG